MSGIILARASPSALPAGADIITLIALAVASVLMAMSLVIRTILSRRIRPLQELLRTGIRADAAVVGLQTRNPASTWMDRSMASLYFPVVRFVGPAGEVEAALQVGASIPPARIGDIIEVRYDAADPERVIAEHGGLTSPRGMSCLSRIVVVVPAMMGVLVLLAWVVLKFVLKLPG